MDHMKSYKMAYKTEWGLIYSPSSVKRQLPYLYNGDFFALHHVHYVIFSAHKEAIPHVATSL